MRDETLKLYKNDTENQIWKWVTLLKRKLTMLLVAVILLTHLPSMQETEVRGHEFKAS